MTAAGVRPPCADGEPEAFFVDGWTTTEQAALTATANRFCGSCPLLVACGELADRDRLWGLWSGSYRVVSQGQYKRRPLIPNAPLGDLPVRPVGAHVGRWAA